jgi:hypothetical protein
MKGILVFVILALAAQIVARLYLWSLSFMTPNLRCTSESRYNSNNRDQFARHSLRFVIEY